MILAQDLRNQLAFALDAEGSDHYRDDLDYIPAINASVKWLTNVVNAAYGQNKIGEEFFRDLAYSGVFLTSDTSRVSLNVFPSEVWTILAVYANPITKAAAGVPVPATPDSTRSYYLPNRIHLSSSSSCKRLDIEEWALTSENPFEAGYQGTQLCPGLQLYAYLAPYSYSGTSDVNKMAEIEIRPDEFNKELTVFWAKKPSVITALSQNIEYPNSVFQLLFDKALNYIAYKQGDQTTLYSVSAEDIQELISIL
jgi:hypothetical protein